MSALEQIERLVRVVLGHLAERGSKASDVVCNVGISDTLITPRRRCL